MKTQNSYLKKIAYFIRPIKEVFLIQKKIQSSNIYVQLCTQYLVGNPFAEMTASMRRGMEVFFLYSSSLCVLYTATPYANCTMHSDSQQIFYKVNT